MSNPSEILSALHTQRAATQPGESLKSARAGTQRQSFSQELSSINTNLESTAKTAAIQAGTNNIAAADPESREGKPFVGVQAASANPVDLNTDGVVDEADWQMFLDKFNAGDLTADLTTDGTHNGVSDGKVTLSDYAHYLNVWSAAQDAQNSGVQEFHAADMNQDGDVDSTDWEMFLGKFNAGDMSADVGGHDGSGSADGELTLSDISHYLNMWSSAQG